MFHSDTNFNPRAPCGARPKHLSTPQSTKRFQPTRPLRGATIRAGDIYPNIYISTHAPLAGRDWETCAYTARYIIFQPTRPLRGATFYRKCRNPTEYNISTHAPLAGRDPMVPNKTVRNKISTHAPLAGRDSKSVQITMHIFAITDKFQMLLHRMPPVRAFCSFLMQENHADFGCEPPR